MKRIAIVLVIALMAGYALFADEAVMIDFNKLVADYPSDKPAENLATITDFSDAAGSSFDQKDKDLMKTSLAIANWEVVLNSSAKSVETLKYSYTKPTKVRDTAAHYKGETIMGIRINFPAEAVNAYALIAPPFEIPAYADKTEVDGDGKVAVVKGEEGKGRKFDNVGVVKNVGVLKSISVNVFGNNTPHGISVIMKDQNNREIEFFLGYMSFDGWRTLTWDNPNYIQDVRDRDLHTYPLYPQSAPFLKVAGFRVYRDASMSDSADFVGYVKDVSIVYDKAILNLERDVDDEGTWNILSDRESSRRNAELKRLGQRQVQRFLEKRKMHVDAEKTEAAPAPAAAQ